MSISRLSGGTPPYSATWTINGQSAGSGMSVNYTFTRAGNCTITAVVTDNSGQTKTVSRTITVGGFSIQPHIK
jgi:PKD repeat protein